MHLQWERFQRGKISQFTPNGKGLDYQDVNYTRKYFQNYDRNGNIGNNSYCRNYRGNLTKNYAGSDSRLECRWFQNVNGRRYVTHLDSQHDQRDISNVWHYVCFVYSVPEDQDQHWHTAVYQHLATLFSVNISQQENANMNTAQMTEQLAI